MKKNLYLLCGIPASGKTAWAQSFVEDHPWTIHISRDQIRFSLMTPQSGYFDNENQTFEQFYQTINKYINDNHTENIIADATHITEISRNKLLYKLNLDNVNIIPVNFITPTEICVARNTMREGRAQVPETALLNMAKNFTPALLNEKYPYKEIINIITKEASQDE